MDIQLPPMPRIVTLSQKATMTKTMRRLTPLLLLLALHLLHVLTDDKFCINYDLENEEQWPPYTQCFVKTE